MEYLHKNTLAPSIVAGFKNPINKLKIKNKITKTDLVTNSLALWRAEPHEIGFSSVSPWFSRRFLLPCVRYSLENGFVGSTGSWDMLQTLIRWTHIPFLGKFKMSFSSRAPTSLGRGCLYRQYGFGRVESFHGGILPLPNLPAVIYLWRPPVMKGCTLLPLAGGYGAQYPQ